MTLDGLKHIWAFFFFWCAELHILTIPPIECDICHIFFEDFPLRVSKYFTESKRILKKCFVGGRGLRGRGVGANFNRSVLRSETASSYIFLKASLSKEYQEDFNRTLHLTSSSPFPVQCLLNIEFILSCEYLRHKISNLPFSDKKFKPAFLRKHV